jgi:hypothetical protein
MDFKEADFDGYPAATSFWRKNLVDETLSPSSKVTSTSLNGETQI